eukprot:4319487-Prymnesium_polylepis.2
MWIGFLRPILALWAGLNLVDDFGVVMRFARLVTATFPGMHRDRFFLCNVCDDVMDDMLKGGDGLRSVPCAWACLRIPQCMRMCETLKGMTQNSSHFPCIAAGYCDAVAEGEMDAAVECSVAPMLRCVPERLCKRERRGARFACVLKPGYGRWVGLANTVSKNTAAFAAALLQQPHCNEPDAGPFCIATPAGLGWLAEMLGHVLTLGYGSVATVRAIETPGGDDDRQWLTFWLILALLLTVESKLLRVLLSAFPRYYEAKLGLLAWLLFRGGARAAEAGPSTAPIESPRRRAAAPRCTTPRHARLRQVLSSATGSCARACSRLRRCCAPRCCAAACRSACSPARWGSSRSTRRRTRRAPS